MPKTICSLWNKLTLAIGLDMLMTSVKLVVYFILFHRIVHQCAGYDYCQNRNPGSQKLFCLGVDGQVLDFGAGYGCLSGPTCSIIISGRKLYRNSTWFKVYIPIEKEAIRIDIWFLITKQDVRFARDSDVTKKLGVRDTMIAKGEVRSNGSLNLYSYQMTDSGKIPTSSSFFSFAPDRKSSRICETFGSRNYTVFSWRTSEYLREGPETFNYHKTPVRVTLRIVSWTLTSQTLRVIRADRHMIFDDPALQQPEGQLEYSMKSREEL